MKTQKNKKMTLDGLAHLIKSESKKSQEEMAVMVKNAFQGNQEYMDKRFDAIGEDFGNVHYKLDKIDKKLDSQEKIIFNHEGRIDKLEVDGKKVKKALAI